MSRERLGKAFLPTKRLTNLAVLVGMKGSLNSANIRPKRKRLTLRLYSWQLKSTTNTQRKETISFNISGV